MEKIIFNLKEFFYMQAYRNLINKVNNSDIIPTRAREEINLIEDDFSMGYITWQEMYYQIKYTLNQVYVNI